MADIIQIQEKGVVKYVQTHKEAVVGLSKKINVATFKPTYKTGFSDYSSGQTLDVYVVGNQVFVTGAFKNASDIAAGAEVVIANIPEGCRPTKLTPNLCQGTGSNIFALTINQNGDITLERYRKGADFTICYANSWLTVNMSYITEETND